MSYKAGRLHADELKYIYDHVGDSTADEIAAYLNRKPELIRKYITQKLIPLPAKNQGEAASIVLRDSVDWLNLKQQFTSEELQRFEYKYTKLMQQLGEDVVASEEMEVINLIKIDLLKDRSLVERKRAVDDCLKWQFQIDDIRKNYMDIGSAPAEIQNLYQNLQKFISGATAAQKSITKEYNELDERYTVKLHQLKVTRDQRFKTVENSKETFFGFLNQLRDRGTKDRLGREAEIMRAGRDKAYDMLGASHKYLDGSVDQPILSSETLGDDNEESIHNEVQNEDLEDS